MTVLVQVETLLLPLGADAQRSGRVHKVYHEFS